MFGLKKDPKEANYIGGKKHWAESIENVGFGGDMISLHPDENFNTNTVLTVNPGEQAVFIKNGQIQQVFSEGRYVLKTENYPFISRIRNSFTGGMSTFTCRVYFVRTASSVAINWGFNFKVRDKLLNIQTTVLTRGSYRVNVANAGIFLSKLIGNNISSFTPNTLTQYFKDEFEGIVKSVLVSACNKRSDELLGIESELVTFANEISPTIQEAMQDYGVGLLKFAISAMEVKDDEFRRVYDELHTYGDKWGEAKRLEVMKTIATTIRQNPQSSGSIIEMIMAGNIAGILGGKTLSTTTPQANTASTLGNSFDTVGQIAPPTMSVPAGPPPIQQQPSIQYYANVNQQQVGPLTTDSLRQFVQVGVIKPTTPIWRAGLVDWTLAQLIPELAPLFTAPTNVPPII